MLLRINKNINEIVGALFFILLISIGFFTIVKKNIKEVKDPLYLPVILESAESMRIGSNVTLLGVPIGILGSLHYIIFDVEGNPIVLENKKILKKQKTLMEARGQFVIAILDITSEIEMYSNYSIVTQYPSIFEVKTIDIRPGKKVSGAKPLKVKFLDKNEVIALRTNQKIPFFRAEDIVVHAENFGDPLFLLTEIVAENQSKINKITKNLAEITDKINRGNGNFSALLNQKGLEKDSIKLLYQISILSQDLGEGLEAYRETNSIIDSLKILVTMAFAGI